MQVIEVTNFKKAAKKLHKNQKLELDKAIKILMYTPSLGETKRGDLYGVKVYKFKMVNQEMLLAYRYEQNILILLALGSHENFYRDMKNL